MHLQCVRRLQVHLDFFCYSFIMNFLFKPQIFSIYISNHITVSQRVLHIFFYIHNTSGLWLYVKCCVYLLRIHIEFILYNNNLAIYIYLQPTSHYRYIVPTSIYMDILYKYMLYRNYVINTWNNHLPPSLYTV